MNLIYYIASAVAVLFVLVPHEFAHAFVAYKCGDGTAKFQGRLTLNPLKHFDPAGFVLCLLTGFGWAKPVPIYPSNFRKYRRGLFLTAIAGVVTNYIIAFFAFGLYLFVPWGLSLINCSYYIIYFFETTFFLIFLYSLSVFVFNLLPLYPLDGFRIIESCTRGINPVRRFLRNYGLYILIALVLESFICDKIDSYLHVEMIKYFDILGYVQYFVRNIIGFPIKEFWYLIVVAF